MLQVSRPHLDFLSSLQGPRGQGPHHPLALPVKKVVKGTAQSQVGGLGRVGGQVSPARVRRLDPRGLLRLSYEVRQGVGIQERPREGPCSQVPRDEAVTHTKAGGNLCPAPVSPLAPWPAAWGSPLHTVSQVATPSAPPGPAHLWSCSAIPARKPIQSCDPLGALPSHHAPRPRQPRQPLGDIRRR